MKQEFFNSPKIDVPHNENALWGTSQCRCGAHRFGGCFSYKGLIFLSLLKLSSRVMTPGEDGGFCMLFSTGN